MKLSSAALLLINLHAIQAGKESVDLNGSAEGSCLNQVYQQTHPNTTLQCLSTHRFWSKISAESNSQCVEGRTLSIKNLSFQSTIDWEAYDFGLYISTSETFAEEDNVQTMNPYLMPLYGESCEVKTLDGENGVDADGDSCYDVLPFGSGSSNADNGDVSVITVPELLIPCSSYDGMKGTVKLQFCASWRGYDENADCDVNGVSPCSFDGCSCEVVDLGVQIVGPEDAKPTCEPTAVNGTNAPTIIEAPTAPNGKPAVTDTPAPSPFPSLIGIDTDMPSPAPFVITVTSSPISIDTPPPTVNETFGSDDATDDGTADDLAGSDDATQEDEVITTCKNNAVITAVDVSGSIQMTTPAAHGACAILSDSSIIYYPIPNYLGDDFCGYSFCIESEMSGEFACTEASLNVNVVECPIWGLGTPSPVANEDFPTMSPTCDYATIDASNNEVNTPVNTPVDVQVLEDDMALDGLPLDVVAILFPGNNGVCTITNDGNTITYTPNTNYFGSDKCIYTACDEEQHCDSATVIINVIPSSEKVVAIDDEVSTNITTPVDIFALENDIQVDGYDLTITKIVVNSVSGDCVIVNQGTVVMYIPEPDFIGTDYCVYETCDDREVCDEANITITVNGSHCDDKEDVTEAPTPRPITPQPTMPTFAWVPTTASPTSEPTNAPSLSPIVKPTTNPTPLPSAIPSDKPSNTPTASPSNMPVTGSPTKAPITPSPTPIPTVDPSNNPTTEPTISPTLKPVLTWTLATPKPVTPQPTPYPVEPVTPTPTPCDARVFFLYNNECTNAVFIAGQFSYDSVVSCCDTNFGAGSYMSGGCVYKDACSTSVDTTDSPHCAPEPLSPIDISGEKPTQEPTQMPVTLQPTLNPVTAAPTTCDERSFFYYDNTCTNMVYSADAISYSSATECCDENVAVGSLMNGRCEYVDMCNKSTEQPTPSPSALGFPKDTLPPTSLSIPEDTVFPTAGIPIVPDGLSKTIPPTPFPSMLSVVKTYTPTPAPSEFDGEMPSTPAPTFGSTPTVGTSTTLSPVRERGD